jgi:competence protein ComEC
MATRMSVRPWVIVLLVLSGTTGGVLGACDAAAAGSFGIAAAALALVSHHQLRHACLLLLIVAGAAANGALARERALASPLEAWFLRLAPDDRIGDPILTRGRLAEDAVATDIGVRLIVDVEQVYVRGWQRIHGRAQVHVNGALSAAYLSAWTARRGFTAPVIFRRPQIFRNPGSGDESWQRLRRTTDLIGTIKSSALVSVTPAGIWDETAAAIRRHVRRTAVNAIRSATSQAIVIAILIGDRAGLGDGLQRRLKAAGTYHVIAISGGNVALLTAGCFLGLRLFMRSFRVASLLSLAIVVAYGSIVGGDASVRRAVLAASLYLVLGLVDLVPPAINVLGAIALVLALVDPMTVVDVGAWLSFGATLAIVLWAARFTDWATGTSAKSRSTLSFARRVWVTALGVFSATLAAEVFLIPISAAVFARVSVFGLVLNFVAIPAMAVVQFAGVVMAACAGWWSTGARGAGIVADYAARGLVQSSAVVDAAPWLVWRVAPGSLFWPACFYAGLFACVFIKSRRSARAISVAVLVSGVIGILTAPGTARARPPTGSLRVTVFDVGQGDAILVQFPSGQTMLVDAGGVRGGVAFGSRVVTPAIWASGVRRLDWLAITHGDIDHVGGALDVERDLTPREIWEGVPVGASPELRELRRRGQDDAAVWRQLLNDHVFDVGSVRVDVLHPAVPDWERPRVRNDDSMVLRLRYGDVEMLLTGDAGAEFEAAFPADGHLPIRLLKVGHHGSRTSSSQKFLDAFQPQIAFISVGRANLFGHPAAEVLARYAQIGARVFRTDLDGAIVIETNGAEVNVRTWTGRRWTLQLTRT